MGFYSLSSSLILLVFLIFISDSESVKTLKKLAVKRGGSLSVPCFYDKQHKLNRKYWCRGYYWSSCRIVAYTNTSGGTSVTDHPTQNMFTVELNSLQDSDSGYYWCAVKIGDSYDRDYVYLMVSADPAVRVENSSVSGQEGGNVSVQCFYSAEYKNEEKKWCRFKDWSCNTFPNSAVKISDDGRRSFRVEMSGLNKSDAGWYWFSAGDVGVTVHLTVTERPTTTTAATTVTTTQTTSTSSTTVNKTTTAPAPTPPPKLSTTAPSAGTTQSEMVNTGFSHSAFFEKESTTDSRTTSNTVRDTTRNRNDQQNQEAMLIWVLLAVGLGLLIILFIIIFCMTRNKHKRKQTEAGERSKERAIPTASATEASQSSGPVYSTVAIKKPSSASASENSVLYSTVATATKKKRVPPAGQDGEVIYSSLLFK
ncbi:uncharacterized protein [Salminus brasiliensis]|uniref:uncharacterized protein isoform X1 n=1 Tax=Salminus brasiliensis TaxID=930266 RepID=UPI003B832D6A